MPPSPTSRIAAVLLATITLAACGGAARGPVPPSPALAPGPASQSESELAAFARARADSARHPYTAADIHFMSAMIGHHAQAIEMARMAPSHGAGGSVRILAERIINA
ncbi:MAG TPA: DUF305 domain-containing protein, partial [Gemmatimonadaceae bacterium]|nr:DUF305 domain-containing protein [Gemmatimonadaceae bacterium]